MYSTNFWVGCSIRANLIVTNFHSLAFPLLAQSDQPGQGLNLLMLYRAKKKSLYKVARIFSVLLLASSLCCLNLPATFLQPHTKTFSQLQVLSKPIFFLFKSLTLRFHKMFHCRGRPKMSEMMRMQKMSTRCSSISIPKAQLLGTSSIVELSILPSFR